MPSIRAALHKVVPHKSKHNHDAPTPPQEPPSDTDQTSTDQPPSTIAPEESSSEEKPSTDNASSAEGPDRPPSPEFIPPSPDADAANDADESLAAEKAQVADLIASYGSSSATAWLEFGRYKLWRPSKPIPQSSFTPVQGYLRSGAFVFAWGNPLVSDPSALEPTAEQFVEWAKSQKLRPIWLCVDADMERILGKDTRFNWSTLSCIVEDVLEPKHVVEIANADGGGSTVKDLKKNLRRAERAHVQIREVKPDEWTDERKAEVDRGIHDWKKSRLGIQIASTSFQPWLDFEHRRYWVAEHEGKIVGLLILSPIHPHCYQIKNAVSFPSAPRGTSEKLIYSVMEDLESVDHLDPRSADIRHIQEESGLLMWQHPEDDMHVLRGNATDKAPPELVENVATTSESTPSDSMSSSEVSGPSSSRRSSDSSRPTSPSETETDSHHIGEGRITVTFGVSASDKLIPVDNLGGWKITWLSKTYNKIVGATGLTKRGDFRNKFRSEHMPSYVCYPSEDGFGLDGANALLKCLRQ
ncbi:hypothetical protein DENSPDRAFT_799830 [Dentipellis sp. KUC8613]|nr:hypothetical protein DENSPDRAFT_799830 [Dentipellis sp. KUC8613]